MSYLSDLQLKNLDEAIHLDVSEGTWMAMQNHFGPVKKIRMAEVTEYIIPYDSDLELFVVDAERYVSDMETDSWQKPIKEMRHADPGNAQKGDRYLLDEDPTGSWETYGFHKGSLLLALTDTPASPSQWVEVVPQTGWLTFVEDEGFYYASEFGEGREWISFPFIYPNKSLDFYSGDETVGFKMSITENKLSVTDSEDSAMMQWNSDGVTILKDFTSLADPTAVGGGFKFRNEKLYVGINL